VQSTRFSGGLPPPVHGRTAPRTTAPRAILLLPATTRGAAAVGWVREGALATIARLAVPPAEAYASRASTALIAREETDGGREQSAPTSTAMLNGQPYDGRIRRRASDVRTRPASYRKNRRRTTGRGADPAVGPPLHRRPAGPAPAARIAARSIPSRSTALHQREASSPAARAGARREAVCKT